MKFVDMQEQDFLKMNTNNQYNLTKKAATRQPSLFLS
jgi:hypothetical protein